MAWQQKESLFMQAEVGKMIHSLISLPACRRALALDCLLCGIDRHVGLIPGCCWGFIMCSSIFKECCWQRHFCSNFSKIALTSLCFIEPNKLITNYFLDSYIKQKTWRTIYYFILIALHSVSPPSGVTWGKVVSLYAVAGALAVDCVRHGHPAMVHTIVDCMGEFVRKSLTSWLKRRGGWVRETFFYSKSLFCVAGCVGVLPMT